MASEMREVVVSSGKGKGKGTPPPHPSAKGSAKGIASPAKAAEAVSSKVEGVSVPMMQVVARLMDGSEIELTLGASDTGAAVKHQISQERGISVSRLKLIVGTGPLDDMTTVASCGLVDGDAINVIILSPLHGSLNRSGLNVPIDVMEMKMELHDALASRLRPVAAS